MVAVVDQSGAVVNDARVRVINRETGATRDATSNANGLATIGALPLTLRIEGFNLFNHGNILGRAQTTYGDSAAVNTTFAQVVAVGTATNAIAALANIDPPRIVQFQVRYVF